MILTTVIAALALQGPPGISQSAMDAFQSHWKLSTEGKYLAALDVLETAYKNGNTAEKQMLGEMLVTMASIVGDEPNAIRIADGEPKPNEVSDPPKSSALEGAKAEDALQQILSEAKNRQIVILNEAHHVPRHRAFGMQLATELKKLGFEYFAAETLHKNAVELWEKGSPAREIGTYSREPVFGDFIRRAMQLGYKPVNYEIEQPKRDGDMYDQINYREITQAENLYNRIWKANPKAKAFIYVGYSHATENWTKLEDGRDFAWMAARLAKLTGLDPLTIDQTGGTPKSRPGADSPDYRYAASQTTIKQPTIFSKEGRPIVTGQWKGKVDLQVFHPKSAITNGRPDWMFIGGHRKPFNLDDSFRPQEGRVLIQAFVAEEPDDSVPMDQVILEAGKPVPVLMLPSGRYRLIRQDVQGVSMQIKEIEQA